MTRHLAEPVSTEIAPILKPNIIWNVTDSSGNFNTFVSLFQQPTGTNNTAKTPVSMLHYNLRQ